ncbi:hypothetical protein Herbaro_17235 [Herbaspirillum sp. WKF16]|jgi:hypothetical protein|uniref:hypothetical protein n=1 Tax=Herbaspirillum sp. WKF16 TaxID=3028312 RepID=UPI0023A959CB|nr:hypothetical protein [Herbaspirillum sp. WKF16]WDZ95216.1 hypothetical protein Herbaro_17235 [Herbaspirillum sp. WKF16]
MSNAMRRLITRDEIAQALKQEASGTPLEELVEQSGASRRAFLKMRKRYAPLSDLLRDLRALQDENLRLKENITDLTIELCRLNKLLSPQ